MKLTKVEGITDQVSVSSLWSNSLYNLYDFENSNYGDRLIDDYDIEKLVRKDETLSASEASQILKIAEECDIIEEQSDSCDPPNFHATKEGIFLDGDMATIKEYFYEYKEFVKSLQERRVLRIEVEL